jgi:hypothetical protein
MYLTYTLDVALAYTFKALYLLGKTHGKANALLKSVVSSGAPASQCVRGVVD